VDRRRQLLFCAVMAGGLLGCHQRVFVPPGTDAATDAHGTDGLTPLTLDIAVTGCASFDSAAVSCTGTAPLTVSLSPVGSSQLTSFLWSFGDGTPASSDRAPTHTYTLPGSYDVNVTGAGTVGTVSQQRRSLIVVQPVSAGAPCDVDNQCGDGLRCICQPGSGCGAAFLRGLCSTTCNTGFCGAGAICVAYVPGTSTGIDAGLPGDAAPAPGDAAAAPLCLAACQIDADCAAGFVCQQLIAAASATGGWVRGCLPLGAAGDFGASCRNANGDLDDTRCTTRYCAAVGALGLCTATCDGSHPCPTGAACGHVDAGRICLPGCSASSPCPTDPRLACKEPAPADAGADGGFSIVTGDAGATYCAPN
jgi:PKD repeat protein